MAKDINKEYDNMLKMADGTMMDTEPEENTMLTDEQVDKLAKTLDSVPMSPDTKLYHDIQNTDHGKQEGVFESESVVINNTNGMPVYGTDVFGTSNVKIDTDTVLDELIGLDDVEPMDVSKTVIDKDTVQNSVLSIYPQLKLSDEDVCELITIADRYKKGEKISYYQSMPQTIKDNINMILGNMAPVMGNYSKEGRNYVAKEILDTIIDNAYIGTSYKDLNASMQATISQLNEDSKNTFSEFFALQKKQYEDNYPKQADAYEKALADGEIKDEDIEKITKAIATLRNVSNSFIQSYTYEDMMAKYKAGKLKVKSIQIEKIKRTCDEFNYKYAKTDKTIDDIRLIIPILDRVLDDDIHIDAIKKFVCLFINYTKNMSAENISEHIFMYYFIKHIESLEYYNHSNEEEEKFYTELLARINEFCKMLG